MYHGDIRLEETIDLKFCTVTTTGAPTTLAGTPVISAYVGNSTTQVTAGITLSVDFDSVTGLHNVRVVATAANGYTAPTNVQLVITTGTVGGTSVVGYVIGSFSIEARSALMPTTVARTLDVSAGGEAGVDWANVGSPTTTLGLSGTTVKTATDVETDTVDLQGRMPAALVSGRMDSSVGAMAANTMTAAAAAADLTTELQNGLALEVTAQSILTDTNELQVDWVNGGRLDLLVDSAIAKIDTIDDFLDTEMAAALAAVDTEVAAILALLDDARAEPGQGAPPVNPDLATKIDYLYKAWRNKKTQTATLLSIFADNGSTVDHKSTVSDDATTATFGEVVTGA